MRGRGPNKKPVRKSATGEATEAREALERRWFGRMVRDDSLAHLVAGEQHSSEPFHRWLTLRQAFAPELVRRFLGQAGWIGGQPLLDPFCGSGTFVLECVRQGLEARGIEALESLAFVARARGARHLPDVPDLTGCTTWEQVAEHLTEPVHRAALICAVARLHTREGRMNRNAPPLLKTFAEVFNLISEDLRNPLGQTPQVDRGDARELTDIADASVGGILTSPPYLSRHDYTLATRPHERVYRYWHTGRDLTERRGDQVRAHPRAYSQERRRTMPPAVTEACQALTLLGEQKVAGVVRSYFEDMFSALAECGRVLADGCPCWMVVGGGRLKGVYVPSDTILADFAETCGLVVDEVRVARRLIPGGRRLGGLSDVAPRESILVLHKESRRG